jgi:hypothetical protein
MARWGVLCPVFGAVLLLALTGCDVRVSGAARAHVPARVLAAQAFGDAPTVDPCSAVDLRELAPALHGFLEPADALDDCPVGVTLADGTATDVHVGPLEDRDGGTDSELTSVADLAGGLTLYRATDQSVGYCVDYVGFTDGEALYVGASPSDTDSKANTCPAADALARNAATDIAEGGVTHRGYPAQSVGSVDPCGLLPASVLTSGGIADASPNEYPEAHECDWYSEQTLDSVSIQFLVGPRPSVYDPSVDSAVRIAGRPTVVTKFQESPASAWC